MAGHVEEAGDVEEAGHVEEAAHVVGAGHVVEAGHVLEAGLVETEGVASVTAEHLRTGYVEAENAGLDLRERFGQGNSDWLAFGPDLRKWGSR